VDDVPNVPHTKIAEELGIPVRKVTVKMSGRSGTGENVLKAAAKYKNSAHMCNKFSQNKK
jgi:hypothetical protein